ncbi:MAG: hypothetical protein SFV51_25315 [Bryobacteraceae bacterium]|nr:hypothetical protein [Bryobacteraceae bacterium]
MRTFAASTHYQGVDQPNDRILKEISTQAARWFLHAAGVLPIDAAVSLRPMNREVAGPALRVDQLLAPDDGSAWLHHFEFQTFWPNDMPKRVTRYQGVIRLENPDSEIRSTVFVVNPAGCPPGGEMLHVDGSYSPIIHARFTLVRMWELDAEPVVRGNDPNLWPLAAVMGVTADELRMVARKIVSLGAAEIEARFVALLGLRYDRARLAEILGEHPMYTREILKHSWVIQDFMKEGREEGLQQGIERGIEKGRVAGQASEALQILRRVLAERFPGLESMPELDAISEPAALENLLLDGVLKLNDRETVVGAIRKAAARYQ